MGMLLEGYQRVQVQVALEMSRFQLGKPFPDVKGRDGVCERVHTSTKFSAEEDSRQRAVTILRNLAWRPLPNISLSDLQHRGPRRLGRVKNPLSVGKGLR